MQQEKRSAITAITLHDYLIYAFLQLIVHSAVCINKSSLLIMCCYAVYEKHNQMVDWGYIISRCEKLDSRARKGQVSVRLVGWQWTEQQQHQQLMLAKYTHPHLPHTTLPSPFFSKIYHYMQYSSDFNILRKHGDTWLWFFFNAADLCKLCFWNVKCHSDHLLILQEKTQKLPKKWEKKQCALGNTEVLTYFLLCRMLLALNDPSYPTSP